MARHASLEEMRKIVTLDKALTAFDARLALALDLSSQLSQPRMLPHRGRIPAEELGVSDTHVRSRMKKAIALGLRRQKPKDAIRYGFLVPMAG